MLLSVVLHTLAIYVPFLQLAFGTVSLAGWDWARSIAVASSVLWIAEAAKFLTRPTQGLDGAVWPLQQ